MVTPAEKGRECVTPLLGDGNLAIGGTVACTNWLGQPTNDRNDLGGWSCSLAVIGASFLVQSAFSGIVVNLVLYLVDARGESNASAAASVNNLAGTSFVFSFIGGFISDSYTGRFWGSVICEILLILSFLSISLTGMVMEYAQSTVLWPVQFLSLYLMAVASGSTSASLVSFGADQLLFHDEKATYFTLYAMTISAGQVFASTVIAYVDWRGRWVLGFWLCTAATGAALVLILSIASKCRIYQAGGNLLLRVGQVLVSAIRNRNLQIPKDPRMLHEVEGEMSAIPGCRKLIHTESLRCLDKAAVRSDDGETDGAWRLCTVTQVEEVKCLGKVIPIGIAVTCGCTALAQISSVFEEQAAATNGELVNGLSIAPASMQFFFTAGALLTGFVCNAIAACWPFKCCGNRGCTSLQLQGSAMLLSCIAMVFAAFVEAHRLEIAHASGSLIYMSWLIPQNFLVGVAANLMWAGGMNFFYNEVSDGMRSIGTCLGWLFSGLGNYLSSVFVILITAITTKGGRAGWIPDDLDEGHLDYFYWFLASFLAFSFGLFLLLTHFYTYRDKIDANSKMVLKSEKHSLISGPNISLEYI